MLARLSFIISTQRARAMTNGRKWRKTKIAGIKNLHEYFFHSPWWASIFFSENCCFMWNDFGHEIADDMDAHNAPHILLIHVHANTFMSCRQAHTAFYVCPHKGSVEFRCKKKTQPTRNSPRRKKIITNTKFNTPNRHTELPNKTDRLILFIFFHSILWKRPADP